MSGGTLGSEGARGAMRYIFGDYVLDSQRQERHHAGEPIKLRQSLSGARPPPGASRSGNPQAGTPRAALARVNDHRKSALYGIYLMCMWCPATWVLGKRGRPVKCLAGERYGHWELEPHNEEDAQRARKPSSGWRKLARRRRANRFMPVEAREDTGHHEHNHESVRGNLSAVGGPRPVAAAYPGGNAAHLSWHL
jgi:hypothetical protein